jgi:tetratricopeptide (TPR) repeat protein
VTGRATRATAQRARAVAALLMVLTSLGACSKGESPAPAASACPELPGAPVVDPALLAFLSRARAAHHMADRHEEAAELSAAVAALDKLLAGPTPGGDAPLPEVREVLADTHARLADLESQLGRYEAAERHVTLGLKGATEPSYFQGHLFEVRGLLEERRAKFLRERGRPEDADRASRAAIAAFEQAMQIQARVIERSLGRDAQ